MYLSVTNRLEHDCLLDYHTTCSDCNRYFGSDYSCFHIQSFVVDSFAAGSFVVADNFFAVVDFDLCIDFHRRHATELNII